MPAIDYFFAFIYLTWIKDARDGWGQMDMDPLGHWIYRGSRERKMKEMGRDRNREGETEQRRDIPFWVETRHLIKWSAFTDHLVVLVAGSSDWRWFVKQANWEDPLAVAEERERKKREHRKICYESRWEGKRLLASLSLSAQLESLITIWIRMYQ